MSSNSWNDLILHLDSIDILIWVVLALICLLCCLCGLACGVALQRKLTKDKIDELDLAQQLSLRASSKQSNPSQRSDATFSTLQPPSTHIPSHSPMTPSTIVSSDNDGPRFQNSRPSQSACAFPHVQISTPDKPSGATHPTGHDLQDSLCLWDNPVYHTKTNTDVSVTMEQTADVRITASPSAEPIVLSQVIPQRHRYNQRVSATPVPSRPRPLHPTQSLPPAPSTPAPMHRMQSAPMHRMQPAPMRRLQSAPMHRVQHGLQQAMNSLAEENVQTLAAPDVQRPKHAHIWTDASLAVDTIPELQMEPRSNGIVGMMGMFGSGSALSMDDNNSNAESIQSY